MPERRPAESKRARRGLGARSPEGETTPATPRGRMPGKDRGSRAGGDPEPPAPPGRARLGRDAQARRRTVRDNPDAAR